MIFQKGQTGNQIKFDKDLILSNKTINFFYE